MLERVISGGQTGADMAGLLAAEACGIPTGGWMPKGWRTENGPRPDLAKRFGLKEADHADYRVRTRMNIRDSDATLILTHHELDGGSAFTAQSCQKAGRPWLWLDLTPRPIHEIFSNGSRMCEAVAFVRKYDVKILNIAGNRESKSPGLQRQAISWLTGLFELVNGGRPSSATSPQEGQRSER